MKEIILLVKDWGIEHGIMIIGIVVVVLLINAFSHIGIERAVRRVIRSDSDPDPKSEKKREDTLIKVTHGLVRVMTWIVGVMMIISEFGVDIGPLLAAAGVVGIAVGFGGQYLIRDLIAGLFIILENQYRVGDVIKVGDKSGTVENINLRLTTIRNIDGIVHHIPNGQINTASNFTKNFSRINIDVGVGYNSDIEKVEKIVNKIGEDMMSEEEWSPMILKAPKFTRITDFADSAIIIKILGDTLPGKQWSVAGEVRKRIKIAFDKEGIEIPFPQRVVHSKK